MYLKGVITVNFLTQTSNYKVWRAVCTKINQTFLLPRKNLLNVPGTLFASDAWKHFLKLLSGKNNLGVRNLFFGSP